MNQKIGLCSLCYLQKAAILSSCGCFICTSCLQNLNGNYICPNCKKPIDFKKSVDLKSKDNFKKISYVFEEPENNLKKIIEAIKFQKMHQKKYISFLENKIDHLIKENKDLKMNLNNFSYQGDPNQMTAMKPNRSLEYSDYRDDLSTANSSYIDLSKIKKIEPRQAKRNNKMNSYQYTPIDVRHTNVNNLNAQTSGQFMKQKNLINLNINNPSARARDNSPFETAVRKNSGIYGYKNY